MNEPKDLRPQHYLREWREAKQLSLSDMATLTPYTKSTLSRIERGKMHFFDELLQAYADVLHVPAYTLLQRRPGGPEELFVLIDQLITEGADEMLEQLAEMSRILVKQR